MCKEHSVYLAVTMDTKAREAFFLKKEIEDLGHLVKIIDIGTRKKSPEGVEITQAQVLDGYLDEAAVCETRSEAARYVTAGLNKIVRKLYEEGRLAALISLGGSGGSSIASEAMHQLPLGVPKVIVTTMASGNTLPYVQGEDILLINPVVDIQNLNFMTRHVLRQASITRFLSTCISWYR